MVTSRNRPAHLTRFNLYTKTNLPFVLSRTLCDSELHWEKLLNACIQRYKKGSRTDPDVMPKVWLTFPDFETFILLL